MTTTSENKLTRKTLGTVTSDKMQKSATVLVERKIKHPVYGKYIKKSNKIHVHDELNVCQVGDTVLIEECAPISKTKSWKLSKVISDNSKGQEQ
ncbi:MAG: 30S ribosomal protein S17 [Gammaproteobacteria bacterium]|nr:MAG: 30S ribosomal protein S17 [Gammaproteobacteria bacterium]